MLNNMPHTISNTQGQINFDYRVEILVDGLRTTVSLLIKLPNVDDYTFWDSASAYDSDSVECLNEALTSGSQKWGIDLITLKNKVA